ncbi:unnamed protein product [Cuscuta campestris]|uniref:SHSP domain-containing protein n=1 Tax=Cuscuta campestris TaxID=132261 RepID=A0A484NER9_9ASTE|nr:unnamed protein product [Cuscuta campestris]
MEVKNDACPIPLSYNYEDVNVEFQLQNLPTYDTLILHLPDGFTMDHASIGVTIIDSQAHNLLTISGHKHGEGDKWNRFVRQFKVSKDCSRSRMYATFRDEKDLCVTQFKPPSMLNLPAMEEVVVADPNEIAYTNGLHVDAEVDDRGTLHLPGFTEEQVRVEVIESRQVVKISGHKQPPGGRMYYADEVYTPSEFKGWIRCLKECPISPEFDANQIQKKTAKEGLYIKLAKFDIPIEESMNNKAEERKEESVMRMNRMPSHEISEYGLQGNNERDFGMIELKRDDPRVVHSFGRRADGPSESIVLSTEVLKGLKFE